MKNNDQVYDILLPPTGATTLPLDLFGCFPAFLLNWLVIYVKVITLGVGILRESSSGSKGRHRTHPSLKILRAPNRAQVLRYGQERDLTQVQWQGLHQLQQLTLRSQISVAWLQEWSED